MTASYGTIDRTTLLALTGNLDIGDVADPALRLAYFQYLADYGDATYNGIQSQFATKIAAGALSELGVINVKSAPYYASGLATTFTGSIAINTKVLNLTTTPDFAAGQGINLQGVAEVASLLMTAGASSSANCTVTLNGVAFLVALTSGNTATQVATAIRAATFAGWTTGSSGTTVTFTSTTTGVKTDSTYSAGTTGATGTMSTTTQGTTDQISIVSSVSGLVVNITDNATRTITAGTVLHDDTVAIQTASNSLTAQGSVLMIPYGTYNVGSLVFNLPAYSNILCFGQLISNSQSGVAVKIGNDTLFTSGLYIQGLDVRASVQNWTNGVIGIQLMNLSDGEFHIKRVLNFKRNIECNSVGSGNGFAYNKIYIGRSDGGKESLFLTASASGFCNENSFYGGEFKYNGSDPVDSSCCLLTIDYYATNLLNNNHFYSPSFESGLSGGALCCSIAGTYNQILYARAESTGNINLLSTSTNNMIILGYDSVNVAIVSDVGTLNFVQTARYIHMTSDLDKMIKLINSGSSGNKVLSVVDPSGNERYWLKASGQSFSNQSGYFESGVRFNSATGTFTDRGVFSGSGSPEGVTTASTGSIFISTSTSVVTAYMKESGAGNTGWIPLQSIHSFATGSRPTVTTVGFMCFDTTLGKPIWWNGTVWKDATGATV